MNNIECLDTMIIPDDVKHYAEIMFMKKKMYYNMKIKNVKKVFQNLINAGEKGLLIKNSNMNMII